MTLEIGAMGKAVGLREDFDAAALRRLSRMTKTANQARRLLALAEIYDGGSRSAAARIGGVGLQIVRDWVLRFNARGPDGLLDGNGAARWFGLSGSTIGLRVPSARFRPPRRRTRKPSSR